MSHVCCSPPHTTWASHTTWAITASDALRCSETKSNVCRSSTPTFYKEVSGKTLHSHSSHLAVHTFCRFAQAVPSFRPINTPSFTPAPCTAAVAPQGPGPRPAGPQQSYWPGPPPLQSSPFGGKEGGEERYAPTCFTLSGRSQPPHTSRSPYPPDFIQGLLQAPPIGHNIWTGKILHALHGAPFIILHQSIRVTHLTSIRVTPLSHQLVCPSL